VGDKLLRLREEHPILDVVLRVQERFGAIGGGPLASSIAMSAFFSLFPLLLVAIAVIGFLSSNDSTLAGDIIRQLGVTGDAATTLRDAIATAEGSKQAASLIGLAGLLWSGLGVVGSIETACNAAWQVTGRGMIDKLYGLLWLIGSALLFFGSFGLSSLLSFLPGVLAPVTIVVGLALNMALFLWTFRQLGNTHVGWRRLVPGAVLAGIGFEALKVVGAVYVPRLVASSSAMYGALGIVFAVLTWLAFYGRLIVYANVLNVVLHERAEGTVVVELRVPRVNGDVPLAANRGGAIDEKADAPV
jgi:membrane protein